MPTQNISLDYDDVQTVKWSYDTLFFNNLNVEKIVLDTQTTWEIPRTSTITSSGGLFPVSLVRTGDRFLDGGARTVFTMNATWSNLIPSNFLPYTFNIRKLGFKLEWRGATNNEDSGSVRYVKFSFTTNGDAIPDLRFDLNTDYVRSSGAYTTYPDILYFDVPSNVRNITINSTVGMLTNDNNNGGAGYRLTLHKMN